MLEIFYSKLMIAAFTLAFAYMRGDGDLNGDGKRDVDRAFWVAAVIPMLFLIAGDYSLDGFFMALPFACVTFILGLLPTQTLLTAIHGRTPKRLDTGIMGMLQLWAIMFDSGKPIGVAFGFMRGLFCLPAIFALLFAGSYLSATILLILSLCHGGIYYAWGLKGEVTATRRSELTIGFLIALSCLFS
jgi:hypothetical protein